MHRSGLLLFGFLALLPVGLAADEIAEPACEETPACDESQPSACPGTGNTACIEQAEPGTRLQIGISVDAASLERLTALETAFRSFRRPEAVDLSETVIRIYDADGKSYKERKLRFDALPRDFVRDLQRHGREPASFASTGRAVDAATASVGPAGLDPRSLFPLELAPTLDSYLRCD